MSASSISDLRQRLARAVRTLCPVIAESVRPRTTRNEYELRRDLVSCVIGSQVSYSMAANSMDNLVAVGLLNDRWWSKPREGCFEPLVYRVLNGSRRDLPHPGSYRFPRSKAKQLGALRDSLAEQPILSRIATDTCVRNVRSALVRELPGVGPKQASMFLMNSGIACNLAVLDTHIVRFMTSQQLMSESQATIGTLSSYERAERIFVTYADTLGYPAGIVDWAIWITMRAARELSL